MSHQIDYLALKGKAMQDFIAVLDFGSQYAHLIAKRIRHLGAYTQIFSPSANEEALLLRLVCVGRQSRVSVFLWVARPLR